jgi:hypothetical protein
MKEFKKHTYKEGHVYKINDGYFHKCVGYNGYTPIIDYICILDNVNDGHYNISYQPNGLPIPSLDFVNGVMVGKITEIDPAVYEDVLICIKNITPSLKQMINNGK